MSVAEVPEGWNVAPFSALADYVNGRAFKPEDWDTEGLPIIRIAQITNPNAETNFYAGHVDPRNLIDTDDLIFSWSATLAVMRWSKGPAVLNQHLFKVTPARGVDREWLQFRLEASIPELADEAHGTTMKHIRKGTLSSKATVVPPLDEQRRIAEVLRSVDDAIAAKQAMLAATKQFKRTCREAAVERFQDRAPIAMQSVLASIDAGWSPECDSEPANYGEWSILKTSSVVWEGYDDSENKRLPAHLEPRPHLEVTADDILITRAGPAGRTGVVAIARETDGRRMLSDKIIRLRVAPEKAVALAVAELLSSDHVQAELIRSKSGMAASQTNISQKIVLALKVHLPSLAEQQDFADEMAALQDAIELGQAGLHEAQRLKAALTSDLLAGRVRVPS